MDNDFRNSPNGVGQSGETREWISAFSTSLLTTRANESSDRTVEITQLMQTPEFASLLIAAEHLADSQKLSKEEATERLVECFRKIDHAWTQTILRRGLKTMIES